MIYLQFCAPPSRKPPSLPQPGSAPAWRIASALCYLHFSTNFIRRGAVSLCVSSFEGPGLAHLWVPSIALHRAPGGPQESDQAQLNETMLRTPARDSSPSCLPE